MEILQSEPVRRAIELNIDRDPVGVAMDSGVAHARLVASQIKYLQRARTKLPSYYAARCIIPSLAFEQSSGEAAASAKPYGGELCIDLTCGLGVDSLALSKGFSRVIAVERDPVLAETARWNFRLIGVNNITVLNISAERFVTECLSEKGVRLPDGTVYGRPDLIYTDPDRRSRDGRKLSALQDCSPDITSLWPKIISAARAAVVKLSPLFDVAQVPEVFGPGSSARVVSVGGECKEVLAEWDGSSAGGRVTAVAVGRQVKEYSAPAEQHPVCAPMPDPHFFERLVVPDVALQKARLAVDYFRGKGFYIENDNSFALAGSGAGKTDNLMGKSYRIVSISPYSPKKLKRELKSRSIDRINILKRDFPLSADRIASSLGVREGGNIIFAFTTLGGGLYAIECES